MHGVEQEWEDGQSLKALYLVQPSLWNVSEKEDMFQCLVYFNKHLTIIIGIRYFP